MGKSKSAIESAEAWLRTAEITRKNEDYGISAYSLEMSLEITLKAVLMALNVNYPKVHDITIALRKQFKSNKKISVEDANRFNEYMFVLSDLIRLRPIGGYFFDDANDKASEKELEDLVSKYTPKVKEALTFCRGLIERL